VVLHTRWKTTHHHHHVQKSEVSEISIIQKSELGF
jgi:hypothetical protein